MGVFRARKRIIPTKKALGGLLGMCIVHNQGAYCCEKLTKRLAKMKNHKIILAKWAGIMYNKEVSFVRRHKTV